MYNLKVIHISDNNYRVSGTFERVVTETKSIIHEGETYTTHSHKMKLFNCDDDFKIYSNTWHSINIDYAFIDMSFNVFYPRDKDILNIALKYSYSENTYINVIMWAFNNKEFNLYNKSIVENSYSGKFIDDKDIVSLKNLSVEFELEKYGFNSSVRIDIPIIEVIKFDYVKLNGLIKSRINDIFNGCDYNKHRFKIFKFLLPDEYYKRKLTDPEIINVLNELYKRKIKLIQEIKKNKVY